MILKNIKHKIIALSGALAILLNVSAVSVFAASNTQGTGVSTTPPTISSGIHVDSANPPSTGSVTTLGTYYGTVDWAFTELYSNSWFKKASTTINVTANFGTYNRQIDAENGVNAVNNNIPNITISLVDKNGNTVSTKKVAADKSNHTVPFTVKANASYYLYLGFDTGFYHSGTFTIK